jgi:very-short-patch-repair endonuclease
MPRPPSPPAPGNRPSPPAPGNRPDHGNRPGAARRARRLAIDQAADEYGGVLSRALLHGLGADRHVVRHAVSSGRWRLLGDQTVAIHAGPLPETGLRWRAVWETGLLIAALDGATALQQAGLTGFTTDLVQVSIPHGSDPGPLEGVDLHRVVRRVPREVVRTGIPRTRPAVAAIRAAHWAVSDRQAALLLAMPVQQRLVTPSQLRKASLAVRGRTRRAFIKQVVADIAGGAQSLGELDFATMCRRRGLPEPSRQVVRRGARGRVYLDAGWEDVGLAVEIDGAGHRTGLAVTDDLLRQNAVTMGGELVLRIDLLGLRVAGDIFMDQVCRAHEERSRHRRRGSGYRRAQ